MNSCLYLWLEVALASALFFLMAMDYRRTHEKIYKLLSLVFLFMVFKSLVFQFINITDAKWMLDSSKATAVRIHPSDTLLNSLYVYKNFVIQFLDAVFVILFAYSIIIVRKEADGSDAKGKYTARLIMVLTALLILIGASVVTLSSDEKVVVHDTVTSEFMDEYRIDPDKQKSTSSTFEREMLTQRDYERFLSAEMITELEESTKKFKPGVVTVFNEESMEVYSMYYTLDSALTPYFTYLIGLAIALKVLVIVLAFMSIGSIYGYIANVLGYLGKSRVFIIVSLILSAIYAPASLLAYATPAWFGFEAIVLVLIVVFALKAHNHSIDEVEEEVLDLGRQKEIIIELMRDISSVVGSGDFDLDTVVKHIVDASVKGANGARGGTILLKDSITNRLQVSYVSGLYPPTKSFNIVSGMALTETIIVEKFKSENIAVGEGYLGQVAQSGESIFIPDVMKEENFIQTIPGTMEVASFIAVPLKSHDEVFGVLSVVHDDRLFMDSDLSLIQTLGEQAAITIRQIQMYQEVLEKKQAEKELGVAGEIQGTLVPHTFPQANKYDMYAFSIPAKGVGGDYYDYIDFGNNKIAVTMFDVSGKGVPAALIMVMIRSILRTIATLDEETHDILTKLNNTISEEIVEDRYATGFYLLFDAERGIMSYTNAGHGPLILYRAKDDTFESLDTDGMPVGIMTGVEYGQGYTTLERGDIAVLYTDGITEAMNETHEEYGMDRLYEVIRSMKREPAQMISNKILEEVNRFVGTAPQHDDETLLIFKMK